MLAAFSFWPLMSDTVDSCYACHALNEYCCVLQISCRTINQESVNMSEKPFNYLLCVRLVKTNEMQCITSFILKVL